MTYTKCDVCGKDIDPSRTVYHFGVVSRRIRVVRYTETDMLTDGSVRLLDLCEGCYNKIFKEHRSLTDMARILKEAP